MKKEYSDFLISIGIAPDSLPEDIEDKVGKYLCIHGFDEHYDPTPAGIMCEDILDHISEIEEEYENRLTT